jgi:prepilin-type N-terminal cleavage/methylation domain-containing protein
MTKPVQGFTLAELAIVLIIIGVLLTGVLMTGDTILARVRIASLLSSIKDLATASQAFKTRFGSYPGDLPNAATYITTNGGISAPCTYAIGGQVGNGLVDTATESTCALEHLVKAGFLTKVDFDGANYSINPTVANNVRLSLWSNTLTNENAVRISNLPCTIALEIDSKFDSATAATPFNQGWLTAQDGLGAQIATCVPGGANDPVPTILIKY